MTCKVPKWRRLLDLMQDGRWYSMRQLAEVAGWRYGGRLYDLKQHGWDHEYRARGTEGELEYRLYRVVPSGMQTTLSLYEENLSTRHLKAEDTTEVISIQA